MNWQKDNIDIDFDLNEAFDRYCIDKGGQINYSSYKSAGSNCASVNTDNLVDIKFSMSEMGKRVMDMEESLRQLQMALEPPSERVIPSFAPLSQFAQKDGKKKSY